MKLFYRKYGKGIPIIALHGLYASYHSWIGLTAELSKDYQLILLDLRNHGHSPHSSEHSYPLMSDDLLELFDELAIDKAILMGHSMGGKLAMHFALNHPQRVKGLIVEDISPLAYTSNSDNVIFHQNVINALKALPINSLSTRKEAQNNLLQKLPDNTLCQFLLKNLQRNKSGMLEWRINLNIIEKNLPAIMDSVVAENTKPLDIPSLFIRGFTSSYIAKKDEKTIKLLFPKSSVLTIQNAKHTPHNEQEYIFLCRVKQYLSLLNSAD